MCPMASPFAFFKMDLCCFNSPTAANACQLRVKSCSLPALFSEPQQFDLLVNQMFPSHCNALPQVAATPFDTTP